MATDNVTAVKWMHDVEPHDYDAARNYLTLKYNTRLAEYMVNNLRRAKVTMRRPNDILRATGLPALPISDPGVHRDLMKVLTGKKLSPVLVVDLNPALSEDIGYGSDIADGYHRVSLMYSIDPFSEMPLRVA